MLAELIEKYKRPYIEEGYAKGETNGMVCIIKERLLEKFGLLPSKWTLELDKISDTTQLLEIYRNLSRASCQEEVEKILKGIV